MVFWNKFLFRVIDPIDPKMMHQPGFYPSTFVYSCFPPKDSVSLLFA